MVRHDTLTTKEPLVAAVVVIFAIIEDEIQVLLIQRTDDPAHGLWALPGGRWDGSESLDAAAARKLFEETGVRDLYLEQLFTVSGLDPEQSAVVVAYFALVDSSRVRLRDGDEWPPSWRHVDRLPSLAFDNNRVIDQAMSRVRAKLEYTNIAYGLLPASFTIRELQTTYEAIMGQSMDRRNFRKRMLSTGIIESTGERRRDGAHRPALLYRFQSREPVFL